MAPATIQLLSAGAVKPGLEKVIEGFRRATGHVIAAAFATAPSIVARVGAGEARDIVIAPSGTLERLTTSGRLASSPVAVGRIGVGMLVRAGAPRPTIATVEEFRRSLLDADSLIFNQASTGLYLDSLFERLGLAAQIHAKTTRYPDFAAVLENMRNAKNGELGFGATTVIVENLSKGVAFVGPLPEAIQNYTAYAAALTPDGALKTAAAEFIGFLATAESKSLLAAAGID